MTLGNRLKLARERAGRTLNEVSGTTGVGTSSISEFENDKREPRMSVLNKLAQAYGRPLAFFFDPSPASNEEVVLWREEPDPSLAPDIEVKFLKLCRQYHHLEKLCGAVRDVSLPLAEGSPDQFSYSQAQALATKVRKDLGLGDHPGPALRIVLEEVHAVKIFYLGFDPTGCAASAFSSQFGAAILLNSKNAPWRRSFDLAHELFHILTWNVFRIGADSSVARPTPFEEKLADAFASHLLLPAEALQNSINSILEDGKIGADGVVNIAREYDVSVDALIWRLHFLYHWTNRDDTKEKIKNIKKETHTKRKWQSPESDELPGRYVALATRALNTGQMSTGKFAEYLGVSRQEAESYVSQDAVEDEQIEITPT